MNGGNRRIDLSRFNNYPPEVEEREWNNAISSTTRLRLFDNDPWKIKRRLNTDDFTVHNGIVLSRPVADHYVLPFLSDFMRQVIQRGAGSAVFPILDIDTAAR